MRAFLEKCSFVGSIHFKIRRLQIFLKLYRCLLALKCPLFVSFISMFVLLILFNYSCVIQMFANSGFDLSGVVFNLFLSDANESLYLNP